VSWTSDAGRSLSPSISRTAAPRPDKCPTNVHRLTQHRAGDPAKGPWPAPVADRIEPVVAKYAGDWDAWGHRKIWALAPP
jgi:hypothetical protein